MNGHGGNSPYEFRKVDGVWQRREIRGNRRWLSLHVVERHPHRRKGRSPVPPVMVWQWR